MVEDYLFCEPLLIEKLRNDIPELVDVCGAADLDSLDNEDPTCPCAYVIYAGDMTPTNPAATGGIGRSAQFVTQLWSVVLCVYLPDGRGIGNGVSKIAGKLISKISRSLRGFVPDPKCCKSMYKHSTPVIPDYGSDGYCYYTLTFCVQFPDI